MKQNILLLNVFLLCMPYLEAQELNSKEPFYRNTKSICQDVIPTDTLTIDNEAGKLSEILSVEDGERVAFLTLKRQVNEEDLRFIRDKMTKMKHLCLKEVKLDTIPPNAFNGCSLEQLDLPFNIKYISEDAFAGSIYYTLTYPCPTTTYITGPFPETAAHIRGELRISEDNVYCKETSKQQYHRYLRTMLLSPQMVINSSYAFPKELSSFTKKRTPNGRFSI